MQIPSTHLRTSVNINLHFLVKQLEQIDDAMLARGGGNLVNSPAWQTGHLLTGVGGAAKLLGGDVPTPAWIESCARGSTPPGERSDFPPRQEMIALAQTYFTQALERLEAASPELLQKEMPEPGLRQLLPTIGEAVIFLLTTHAAMHIGQIAAWRRAHGLPPLVG